MSLPKSACGRLADWLQRSGHGQLWQVAHTTDNCGSGAPYADGEIIGKPEHPVLLTGSSAAAGYTVKGDVEEAGAKCSGSCERQLVNDDGCCGCAGCTPLIRIDGCRWFGLHFYER